MTTRLGICCRQEELSMSEGGESVDLVQMVKAFLEDRQRHKEELIEERQWNKEEAKDTREDLTKHEEESRKQMLLLQPLVEGVKKQGEAVVRKAESYINM